MSKLLVILALVLALVRCGGDAKDLCSQLTEKCGANAGNTCRDNTHHELSQYAACSELVQAFSDCIASLTLTCSSDSEITATNGAPTRRTAMRGPRIAR